MPRVSIYVQDEMKARMDEADDRANWSGIAQRAFETELHHLEAVKEIKSMSDVIERLRASKQRSEESDENVGRKEGQEWARRRAEYSELRRLESLDLSASASNLLEQITGEYGAGSDDIAQFFGLENESELTEVYIAAFVEGAIGVWNEI